MQTDRVFTIPNILSMARLVGVPLFLWLVLSPVFDGPNMDGWALLVLVFSGVSDYLDGKLARRWNQVSDLGRILDPAADRLYILSTLSASPGATSCPGGSPPCCWRGKHDGRHRRRPGPPRLRPAPGQLPGKAATLNLMYGFPLLLLSDGSGVIASLAAIFGWAFVGWGTALYWWAGVLYVVQVRRILKADATAD